MAYVPRSTIEIGAKIEVDENEIRRLEKRLKDLGLDIEVDIEEIQRKRNATAVQSPLAVAGISGQSLALTGIGAIVSYLIPPAFNLIKNEFLRNKELRKIDQSKLDLPVDPILRLKALDQFLKEKEQFFIDFPPEKFVQSIVDTFDKKGVILRIEDIVADDPEIDKYFDEEIIKKINDAADKAIKIQQAIEGASKNSLSENLVKPTMDFIESGAGLLQEQERQIEIIQSLKNAGLDFGSEFSEGRESIIERTGAITELSSSIENLAGNSQDVTSVLDQTKEKLMDLGTATVEASRSTEALGKNGIKEVTDQAKQAKPKLDSLNSTTEGIKENAETLDKTLKDGKGAITGYGTAAQSTADKGLTKLEGKIEDVGETASNINLSEVVKDLAGFNSINLFPGFLKPLVQADEQVKQVADTFEETNKSAQNSLDELGVFAADIASEINETFADLIFRGLKGNLDSLSEFWDATFDAMLNTFAQFAATVISNPIRLALDAVLRGESGSGEGEGGGKGFFGTLGGVFDIGKGFKTIGKGLMKIPGVSSIVDGITGLFAEGGALAGIGQFFSSALPVIGAIASVAAFAIPLLSGLFKKTPRLDVDFDSIKTELGRRAAVVNEFLDPEFFSGNIAEISVKRKAGLGVGGDNAIKELIQEQIELTIESVQAILFELPLEMAKSLNDALLATEVDIDTVVAGERLLEFDAKGKKIKEKFEAFINGELQAKFLFAIRDFFVGAFESLGVLPENAQALIDEQFEAFKNAGSREARAEIGQELLATFGAFVDAFNIVSGNVNDSIGQTIQNEEWEYRMAA